MSSCHFDRHNDWSFNNNNYSPRGTDHCNMIYNSVTTMTPIPLTFAV